MITLLAYFPSDPDLPESLRRRLAALPSARLEPIPIPDVDWVARFRDGFQAFRCGRFWIAPVWDDAPPAPGLTRLTVDPGRAFGTGTHETTRLCLAALEGLAATRTPGDRLLDVGTGSGILVIAAGLLGWEHLFGVETDAEALESAAVHAKLNGIRPGLVLGNGGAPFRSRAFALVLANITAPLLLARRAELAALVAPGGRLVLSGLLVADLPEVTAAYEPFGPQETTTDGEWAAVRVAVSP